MGTLLHFYWVQYLKQEHTIQTIIGIVWDTLHYVTSSRILFRNKHIKYGRYSLWNTTLFPWYKDTLLNSYLIRIIFTLQSTLLQGYTYSFKYKRTLQHYT